ncbi:VWA domain-containing protein [Bradyrhizobium sp. ISRA443]|uniref:vWA domain-containing protein n=1 Tax=unclassified Bradyrhizobium TaxID=2631580 RepID=UPI00247A3A16|nr:MULTISPECIES: VWA domain-containing protein [unclassified Bradyrhizobium]WGR94959.1 VWA domain-containing protein [Bradyrhizobium sp. ISRA435]WGR99821.1 VWA domain-containing protein [Bradyrhizobium sp. ISRA436]WGS06711.1 VWA domain-containing protein [Bradyrhizobium sp. ISRA437]WGS13594.1 VWA domain-containing protein [Bradyrhizobium sp. ISRA443]
MRENLHRFFRAARGAGVRVSPAESIDAMRAVAKVGFTDRAILRDTFLLTLAKTQDEKRALGDCFDLFFSQPEPQQDSSEQNKPDNKNKSGANPSADAHGDASGGAENENIGPLAQMLLSQDRSAISTAVANASGAASLPDIRYFTQRGIFQTRILDAMGIQRLRDDIDELTASNPALAERLQDALNGLRGTVRDAVSQALLLYGREEAENLRNEILRNAPLARIEPRQVEQMRTLIRQIARRLRERYSKPRKRQRRGHLDVRRTLRRNAAWGGVPFLTAWKRKHRDRPKIVALCDVSGSVARVSDFFLLLIHSLHEVVDDVRSFAFSGHLIEVSRILETKSPEEAMKEIMAKVGFGSSDYGNSFADFEDEWMSTVTPQTTVIVLGDARSNNLDPRADILRRIGERSKRLVWLNPEGRMTWGFGDSEMPRYATFCSVVRQCATAKQLERAVSDIVATYQ